MQHSFSTKTVLKFAVVVFSLLLAFYFLPYLICDNCDNQHEGVQTHSLTNQSAPTNWSKWDLYTGDTLINHLRTNHLTPPAAFDEPYNLSVKYLHYSEHNRYHMKLLEILKKYHKLDGGFFVEAGALDGHYLSHTLDLEKKHNWNGLLVEASPRLTRDLKSKKRKCWSADVCLTGVPFMEIDYIAKRNQKEVWKRGNGKVNPLEFGETPLHFEGQLEYISEGRVECYSLFSLLTALKVKMVDFFVLDVEGHEFQILNDYPFHIIPIKVIAVEHWLLPIPSLGKLEALMLQKGYSLVYSSTSDYVYVLNADSTNKMARS